jgi:adenine-specific DNA-methyltransferase
MISYFGGKAQMKDFINPFFPKDMETYVEAFSGAFWCYWNMELEKYPNLKTVVYNDINTQMQNIFACAKDYNKCISVLEKQLSEGGLLHFDNSDTDAYKKHFKELFNKLRDKYRNGEMNVNEAPDYKTFIMYLFGRTSSFNSVEFGKGGFSGVTTTKRDGAKLKLNSFLNKLKTEKFQNHLDKLTNIENMDFQDLIEKYDSEKTFIYLDPPYSMNDGDEEGKRNNRLDWYGVDNEKYGASSHERLANVLKNTKAKWALSYYEFPQLSEWFPRDQYRWEEKEFFRSSASFSDKKDEKGREVLIMNY